MSIESRCLQYGKVFDHWLIGKRIDQGPKEKTAVFHLVHQDSHGVESALKVVNLVTVRCQPDAFSLFQKKEYEAAREKYKIEAEQEVLMMNALRGRTNIVDYLDHTFVDWEDNDCRGCDMLIRMELLHDLRSEINRRELTGFQDAEILKIGKDICRALVLCHSKHIIHRDIKPENIFFNEDGNYKLGDFGISRILGSTPMAHASTSIGTPQYLAPEQVSGTYDSRVDIYSLGLVLYELGNGGLLPFATSRFISDSEILPRLRGAELSPPRNVSAPLAKVILKACAHRPQDRYQTAGAFLEALNQVTEYDPDPSEPPVPLVLPQQSPVFCGKCGWRLDADGNCKNPQCGVLPVKLPKKLHLGKLFLLLPLLTAVILIGAVVNWNRNDAPAEGKTSTAQSFGSGESSAITASACAHIWQSATCVEPAICKLCGEIGEPTLGHQWIPATASSPKTCARCGITEGEPLHKVGEILEFGHYEQDNDPTNGAEPIRWKILDVKDSSLLVISENAIDSQQYNVQYISTTWAECSLRQWLNGSFYENAFTSTEREKILTTTVTADLNPYYPTKPGAETQDKIYLLSILEVQQYFPKEEQRRCAATSYIASRGAYVNKSTGGSWWWLRTPGASTKDAAKVNGDGTITHADNPVTAISGTVRPVMWICTN